MIKLAAIGFTCRFYDFAMIYVRTVKLKQVIASFYLM